MRNLTDGNKTPGVCCHALQPRFQPPARPPASLPSVLRHSRHAYQNAPSLSTVQGTKPCEVHLAMASVPSHHTHERIYKGAVTPLSMQRIQTEDLRNISECRMKILRLLPPQTRAPRLLHPANLRSCLPSGLRLLHHEKNPVDRRYQYTSIASRYGIWHPISPFGHL